LILRPHGVLLDHGVEEGLEVELSDAGEVVDLRSTTKPADCGLLMPALVNAHSHLEYASLEGAIPGGDYWPWIAQLVRIKLGQSKEEVVASCELGAKANRAGGVGLIAEHSDRPGAEVALIAGQPAGILFHEVVAFPDGQPHDEVWHQAVGNQTAKERVFGRTVHWALHAPHTVRPEILEHVGGQTRDRVSIHVGETVLEQRFWQDQSGDLADFYRSNGFVFPTRAESAFDVISRSGLMRAGTQLVHCCEATEKDLDRVADSGAVIALCPRSNRFLGCNSAPVGGILDRGIPVGMGMDSAASSGPISMLLEMAEAKRQYGLAASEIFAIATHRGASSLGVEGWCVRPGSKVPLILIGGPHGIDLEAILNDPSATIIEWLAKN
jgi:cytosine/adenosine deaminase-related metal-dependent hydrolase